MRASDRGAPPSSADVDVELDVVDRNNKPPIWDMTTYGPVHIKENVTVGTVVTSVKARLVYGSGHPPAALLNTTNDVVLSVSVDLSVARNVQVGGYGSRQGLPALVQNRGGPDRRSGSREQSPRVGPHGVRPHLHSREFARWCQSGVS